MFAVFCGCGDAGVVWYVGVFVAAVAVIGCGVPVAVVAAVGCCCLLWRLLLFVSPNRYLYMFVC